MSNSGTATSVIASPTGANPRPDTDTNANFHKPVRRHRGRRILAIVSGTVLGLVAIAAGVWTLARSTDSQSHEFGATVDQIVVEEVNGHVTFEKGATGELRVEREWLFAAAPEVQIVESEGTLHVTGGCGSLCRIHVSGTAPAGTALVVRTNAGSIQIAGMDAGVDLTTSAGNVTVTDVGGPAKLRTHAGWIRGTIARGDIDAHTSAGGIDLEVGGYFTVASAMADAGSVRLSVPDDIYRVKAETSLGLTNVDVVTDPDATRSIVVRSDAGNVTVDRLPR